MVLVWTISDNNSTCGCTDPLLNQASSHNWWRDSHSPFSLVFPKNKGHFTHFSVKIQIFPSESRRLLQPSGAIVNLDVWHQLFHRQGWKIEQDLDFFSLILTSTLMKLLNLDFQIFSGAFPSSSRTLHQHPPSRRFAGRPRSRCPVPPPKNSNFWSRLFSDFLTFPWWFSF